MQSNELYNVPNYVQLWPIDVVTAAALLSWRTLISSTPPHESCCADNWSDFFPSKYTPYLLEIVITPRICPNFLLLMNQMTTGWMVSNAHKCTQNSKDVSFICPNTDYGLNMIWLDSARLSLTWLDSTQLNLNRLDTARISWTHFDQIKPRSAAWRKFKLYSIGYF